MKFRKIDHNDVLDVLYDLILNGENQGSSDRTISPARHGH